MVQALGQAQAAQGTSIYYILYKTKILYKKAFHLYFKKLKYISFDQNVYKNSIYLYNEICALDFSIRPLGIG